MKLSDLSITFYVWNWVIYPSLFMYEIEWFNRHFLCMKLSNLSVTFYEWNRVIYPSLLMYEIEWFIRHFLCMKLSNLSVTFYEWNRVIYPSFFMYEIEWFIRENWSWFVISLIFLLRKVVVYPGGDCANSQNHVARCSGLCK